MLENLEIRFSQPAVLNDPFETLPVIHATELTNSEASEEFMAGINQKIGILSLSRNFKNLLMWSHYASNHKGYVLGFDESHDFFNLINKDNEIVRPIEITYPSLLSGMKQDLKDIQEKFLLVKSRDWEYEEEIRIIKHFSYANKTKRDPGDPRYPIYLFDVPKESIKCIYLGTNAQDSLKQRILAAIKKNNMNVNIYQNKLSQTHYGIDSVLMKI